MPEADPSLEKHGRRLRGAVAGTPFRLGAWIRLHGVDLITMALMGALGLGIYEARKSPFL
jgi:diacylglycerol diphosphate phosphatase/phosphatidate phosphatase